MQLAVALAARAVGARVLDASATPVPYSAPAPAEPWALGQLAGRLVEISGGQAPAALTTAIGLVVEAQLGGDRAAWVTPVESSFFPPDASAGGVDLEALPVVRVPDAAAAARAADCLVRSGGFGLVVIDLAGVTSARARMVSVPTPIVTRLAGLARTHDTAVVILTKKSREAASLNSLISLRVEAQAVPDASGYAVRVHALKDKRGGPGWDHREVCRGSVGVR